MLDDWRPAHVVIRNRGISVTIRGRAEDHRTSVVRPPDFDEFWSTVDAELTKIWLDPVLTEVPLRSTDEVEVFEIGYTSLDGVRIAGW
jgi:cephalosporin-C deacetylase-like acetyl esterase